MLYGTHTTHTSHTLHGSFEVIPSLVSCTMDSIWIAYPKRFTDRQIALTILTPEKQLCSLKFNGSFSSCAFCTASRVVFMADFH